MRSESWSALGSVTTACVAVVGLLIAVWQVREARRLRIEQAEPYVAVFLETITEVSEHFVDLVVKNFGDTAAFNVRLRVTSEELRRGVGEGGTETELVSLPAKFSTLVPGQEWRTFFDSGLIRSKLDLPNLYEVEVTFESLGNPKLFKQSERKTVQHTYSFTLDVAALEPRQHIKRFGIHHAAKALREMKEQHEKWTEDAAGGLSVYARNGQARDRDVREHRAQVMRRLLDQRERLARENPGADESISP